MIDILRDHILTLNEEINYRENVLKHKKSLEATLWGLEEQIRLPENSSKEDQEEINNDINHCRYKVLNCNKLLDSHQNKIIEVVDSFKLSEKINKQ